MLQATTANTDQDLQQILDLQAINLKDQLSPKTRKEQGFVTMRFNLEMLRALKNFAPSVVLKTDNHILAYAIVFLKEGIDHYPAMKPLIDHVNKAAWAGGPLSEKNYYIMGQVCVAEELRGSGAFDLLYQKHRELMSPTFDLVVTDIACSNTRSLRAHERVGFKKLLVHRDEIDEWQVVVWDWT